MGCEEAEQAVARIQELLAETKPEPGEKPIGRVMLLQALARAQAQLRACQGQTYDVELTLFDWMNLVANPAAGHFTVPYTSAAASGGHLRFSNTPGATAGLLVEDANGRVIARSRAPLPGTATGHSQLTALVYEPITFTAAELTAQLPVPSSISFPPVTFAGITGTVTLSSISMSLGQGTVTITLSGSIATGPGLMTAVTRFTHSAQYVFAPSRNVERLGRVIDVSAPTAGTLTFTATSGWWIFVPLATTALRSHVVEIEENIRALAAPRIEFELNKQIDLQAQPELQNPALTSLLPPGATPALSVFHLTISPNGITFVPAVSVHV